MDDFESFTFHREVAKAKAERCGRGPAVWTSGVVYRFNSYAMSSRLSPMSSCCSVFVHSWPTLPSFFLIKKSLPVPCCAGSKNSTLTETLVLVTPQCRFGGDVTICSLVMSLFSWGQVVLNHLLSMFSAPCRLWLCDCDFIPLAESRERVPCRCVPRGISRKSCLEEDRDDFHTAAFIVCHKCWENTDMVISVTAAAIKTHNRVLCDKMCVLFAFSTQDSTEPLMRK